MNDSYHHLKLKTADWCTFNFIETELPILLFGCRRFKKKTKKELPFSFSFPLNLSSEAAEWLIFI